MIEDIEDVEFHKMNQNNGDISKNHNKKIDNLFEQCKLKNFRIVSTSQKKEIMQ